MFNSASVGCSNLSEDFVIDYFRAFIFSFPSLMSDWTERIQCFFPLNQSFSFLCFKKSVLRRLYSHPDIKIHFVLATRATSKTNLTCNAIPKGTDLVSVKTLKGSFALSLLHALLPNLGLVPSLLLLCCPPASKNYPTPQK